MRRRDLLALAAGAIAAAPRPVRAQDSRRIYRVAYLGPSPRTAPPQHRFIEALAKAGYVEGRNLLIDDRGFARKPEQFAEAAMQIANGAPDVILCGGPAPGRAAREATRNIPILVNTDDMVGEGFVASMVRPGGNVTGVSVRSPDLDGKRFELLLELIPNARCVGALAGADTANSEHFEALRDLARRRGIELAIQTASTYDEIVPAIEAAKAAGAVGLNVLGSALLFGNRQVIFAKAAALPLPAIYQWPENALEGGLIGYGPSITRIYEEQMSRLAIKIFRGAKPADLPVEHPDQFDLAINLKTAQSLGLTVPSLLLAQAQDVIE